MASSYARAPDTLPPNVDVTRSSIAYGDRALPKINTELGSGDLITQQRALFSLCDLLRNPQSVKLALDSGVVPSLQALLTHTDDTVRLKTTESFFHMASHANGRRVIADSGALLPLAKVFDDAILNVRLHAHGAVERSTQSPSSGAAELVAGGVVPVLVSKIQADKDEIKVVALGTLCNVLKVDVRASIDSKAIPILVELLTHPSPQIAELAAHALMAINVSPDGKDKAVTAGAVPPLVSLLKSTVAATRSAAAAALMSLTNSREGKTAALAAEAPTALIALLSDADDAVKLNAIKAITTLTEHPKAREAFTMAVPLLQGFQGYKSKGYDPDAVARFAAQAVARITWKP